MIILVDYDNIEKAITRLGVGYLVNKIVSKIDPTEISHGRHITIRLYGGWYEHTNFTTRAQNISTDIALTFPNVAILSDNQTTAIVNCEMAYSLIADPTNHLFHTFRTRGIPQGLKAHHPSSVGCSSANCPIISIYNFIKNDVCSQCSTIKPKDIFYRGEQKLIDTMLTSDLIYSSNQSKNLCIVSSDDDLWPGIITTLIQGKKVLHIYPKMHRMPYSYTRNAGNNYIQRNL